MTSPHLWLPAVLHDQGTWLSAEQLFQDVQVIEAGLEEGAGPIQSIR
jgi:hypothetical protein